MPDKMVDTQCARNEGNPNREPIRLNQPFPLPRTIHPFRTAVSFWGRLGTNYLELDCLVPETGLEF